MAALINTLDEDTEDGAAARFLAGCSKLLPTLVAHEAKLPRWCRQDPGATAQFVVWPPACLPDAFPDHYPGPGHVVSSVCSLTHVHSISCAACPLPS